MKIIKRVGIGAIFLVNLFFLLKTLNVPNPYWVAFLSYFTLAWGIDVIKLEWGEGE